VSFFIRILTRPSELTHSQRGRGRGAAGADDAAAGNNNDGTTSTTGIAGVAAGTFHLSFAFWFSEHLRIVHHSSGAAKLAQASATVAAAAATTTTANATIAGKANGKGKTHATSKHAHSSTLANPVPQSSNLIRYDRI
jgi:hypothetical protein